MITKLPRVFRLDDTDTQIYATVAEPGELAIVGSFHFWDSDPDALAGKARQAFAHGFLGTHSFGWATVVIVSPVSLFDVELLAHRVAGHLVERFGAPDVDTALPAAREEIEFAASLCDEHPLDTLLLLSRRHVDNEIIESFKAVSEPPTLDHERLKIWGLDDRSDGTTDE